MTRRFFAITSLALCFCTCSPNTDLTSAQVEKDYMDFLTTANLLLNCTQDCRLTDFVTPLKVTVTDKSVNGVEALARVTVESKVILDNCGKGSSADDYAYYVGSFCMGWRGVGVPPVTMQGRLIKNSLQLKYRKFDTGWKLQLGDHNDLK